MELAIAILLILAIIVARAFRNRKEHGTKDVERRPAFRGPTDNSRAILELEVVNLAEELHSGKGLGPYRLWERRATYRVRRPFRYVEPGTGGQPIFRVPKEDGGVFTTDLASIPFFATWLVPRDGSHTPAAVLHDALIKDQAGIEPPTVHIDLHDADRIFRNGMGNLGVPLMRRWMMWAAVSLRSLLWHGPMLFRALWILVIPVTIFVGLVIGIRLIAEIAGGQVADWLPLWPGSRILSLMLAAVLLCWLVRSLQWGPSIGVGLITLCVLSAFALPLITSFAGFLSYRIIEVAIQIARIGLKPAR